MPSGKPRALRWWFFLAVLLAARGAAFGKEVPLAAVGPGYLVVRAKVCREGVQMDRHLLLDLMCPVPLIYFQQEALFLGIRADGASVDLELGEGTLRAVPVRLARPRLLMTITRDHASELKEVPVAGILGWDAFRGFRLRIDPVAMRLDLLAEAQGGDEPEQVPGRWVVPMETDKGPPRLRGVLEGAVEGLLYLATGDPGSFLMQGALAAAGKTGQAVGRLRVGEAELAGIAPFRPDPVDRLRYRVPGPVLGGLGWDFCRNFRVELDGVNGWAVLDRLRHDPFPEAEQAFLLAEGAGIEGLEKFLAAHPEGPLAARAAAAAFRLRIAAYAPAEKVVEAAERWVRLVMEPERPKACLEGAEALLGLHPVPAEAWALIQRGLEASAAFAERETPARLQHLAGRYWLGRGEFRTARKHLLNAVFMLLHEGPVNLDMGRAWKGLGRHKRAMGAFVRALLDVEHSGPEALGELEALADETTGRSGLVRELLGRLEGRVEEFQAPGRAPECAGRRRPLVELFCGTECRPSVGPMLAFGALEAYFQDGATLLTHHLHSPGPDPLVCLAGQQRGGQLGVGETPRLFVDGLAVLDRGGRAREARALFERIEAAVERARAGEPRFRLSGNATLDSAGRIEGRVAVAGGPCRVFVWLAERAAVYPGGNELCVHRYVSRGLLTSSAGALPGEDGTVGFQGDVGTIWDGLEANLSDLELRLAEQEFAFRWKPGRPDPAELVLVVFVTEEGSPRPLESLLVVPRRTAEGKP